MAEEEQQQQQPGHLPQQTNPYGQVDEEVALVASKEQRRKKRMKCLLYVVIFAVLQIGVITLFAMTIMRFRNPKFRVRSATFESLNVTTTTFNMRMNTEFSVRNTNFGHLRYRNTTVDFYYGDTKVGEAIIQRARARARSTRRFNVAVDMSSNNITSSTQLASDLSAGILPLRAESRLGGRVTIILIMRRNRYTNMNCTMNIAVQSREIQNLVCR